MNRSMEEMSATADARGPLGWPARKEDARHNYAWRLFRIRDDKRGMQHVLAVGTQESGNTGRERVDLIAYLVDTDRFGDWRAGKEVCAMSARRSFGLKLTNGFVVVERESLRSINIGSLCFNEIVKWARRVAPDDTVMPIELLASHVNSYKVENLARRHRFYSQFGLEFEFTNQGSHALASGQSKPITGRDLVSHPMSKFPNIVEVELVSTVQQLAMRQEELEDDVCRLEGAVSRLLKERQRRSDRVVWAAQLLRWPLICAAFAAGVILARPGHFGLHP